VNIKYQPRPLESAIITKLKKVDTRKEVSVNGLNLHFLGELTAINMTDTINYYQRSQQPKKWYSIENIDKSFLNFSTKRIFVNII